MYAAVAPPSSITEGVTVHKKEGGDEEITAPKGRVTSAHLESFQRARAKREALQKQLNKEANKPAPKTAGNKRKEQPKKEEKKKDNEPKEITPESHPVEMMKQYLNPNPQLRGVPQGALGPKSQLEEDIDKAIEAGDYEKAEQLNDALTKHKQASIILTSIECVKYSIEQRAEEKLTRDRKKPKFNWTFDAKANWERKGNM